MKEKVIEKFNPPTVNYSHHRLNSDSQLIPYLSKMGEKSFWSYAERLYRKITMMHPGESFVIDDIVIEENRDLLIKLLCSFMNGGVAQGYYFNATFTEFCRAKLPIAQSKENNLRVKKI